MLYTNAPAFDANNYKSNLINQNLKDIIQTCLCNFRSFFSKLEYASHFIYFWQPISNFNLLAIFIGSKCVNLDICFYICNRNHWTNSVNSSNWQLVSDGNMRKYFSYLSLFIFHYTWYWTNLCKYHKAILKKKFWVLQNLHDYFLILDAIRNGSLNNFDMLFDL